MELGIHYHIRWSGQAPLDWKPFRTKQEAIIVAETIKKPNESYVIAERDDQCERCNEFKLRAFFAVGLLPRTKQPQVSYFSVTPPEDAPLTKTHWIQIALLAVALVLLHWVS